ncbi:ADP-ribosylation factor-like protein 2 [Dictyocoela muelleri]|nr:ADP-ribosylation factor-like protein 2 [Dictyocoela muelleri]
MVFSYLLKKIKSEKKEKRILFLGLDGAGKSTILEKLYGIKNTGPTFGFQIYEVENLTILDVGGQETIRKYWTNYYENVDGVIFVFDMSDGRDFLSLFEEIRQDYNLAGAKFLLLANKSDLVENDNLDDLKCLGVDVKKICAKKNEGLKEAINSFLLEI